MIDIVDLVWACAVVVLIIGTGTCEVIDRAGAWRVYEKCIELHEPEQCKEPK